MSGMQSSEIHPTAYLSPEVELGEGVVVGPFAVIDGPVKIGAGCVIKAHACLSGPLTMGHGNAVFPGAILGEQPQHLKYAGEPTRLEIGDGNIFREHVTLHRGTIATGRTTIGNHNFFMAGAHVAHDCAVGNNCIFANNALLGGHCTVGDGAFLSGNAAAHQFVRIGRLALLGGCSGTSKDIPPFIMQRAYNLVVGVNIIGMRRAGLTPRQIHGVRRAYQLIYRETMTLPAALARVEAEVGDIDTVCELVEFIKTSERGIGLTHGRSVDEAA